MEVGTAEESASANKSLRSAMAAAESNARVVRRRKIIVLISSGVDLVVRIDKNNDEPRDAMRSMSHEVELRTYDTSS